MKVSICLTYYNRKQLLINTLKSIKQSRLLENTEIIIVDDASDDVIRRRWEVYERESSPVLKTFRPELVEPVDAIGSPASVLYNVLGTLIELGIA